MTDRPELVPEALAEGRSAPELPLRVRVTDDGAEAHLERVLRWLPGKRLTARGTFRGGPVAVKILFGRRASRHGARLTAGAEAVREAGLATPPCLARLDRPGAVVLVHAWVDGGPVPDPGGDVPGDLPPFVTPAAAPAAARPGPPPLAPSRRLPSHGTDDQELLRELLAAHGGLHANGVCHVDPHRVNFLFPADGSPLHVLDTDAVRPLGPWPGARRRALAAQFAELTAPGAARVAELLGSYDAASAAARARAGRRAAPPVAPAFADVVRRADARRLRNARLLARKACQGRAGYRRAALTYGYALGDRRLPEPLWQQLRDDPDGLFEDAAWLKDGNSASVVRLGRTLPDGTALVLKRYNARRRRPLPFRSSRGERSWRAGLELRGLGVATPVPLALVQERRGSTRGRGWLLSPEAPGETLARRIEREPLERWPGGLRRDLLRLFARCARYGVDHGDFKATNFVVTRGDRLLLLDLDAVAVRGPGTRARRAWRRDRDRFRRNFTRPEDLAWIDRYLAAPPAEP
jgi:hypothetical protein